MEDCLWTPTFPRARRRVLPFRPSGFRVAALVSSVVVSAAAELEVGGRGGPVVMLERVETGHVDDPILQLAKQLTIPGMALAIGGLLLVLGGSANRGAHLLTDLARMILYFGAQAGMNIYIKSVLTASVVSADDHLLGMPAGFALTALQQITSFCIFILWMVLSRNTPCYYSPKKLSSSFEWFAMCLFSLSFTLNIALNNYSLSMIPISVNLIVRSCLPLSTFLSQQVASKLLGERLSRRTTGFEILAMLCGVVFAVVVVFAKEGSERDSPNPSKNIFFGTMICVVSLFSGSINLALAGVLGTSVHLNAIDTTLYMSVPATLAMIPAVFLYSHPVADSTWETYMSSDRLTDWQILVKVYKLNSTTILLALLSGVLALAYNVLQYGVVQRLSATHTAFAGNFNKAALITLSFFIGLEPLPSGLNCFLMLVGIVGNIACFTLYNVARLKASRNEHRELQSEDLVDPELTATSDDDDE